jgi:hypothetical protein
MTNALEASQSLPEGETALDPGNSNSAPEQTNGEQHTDTDNGDAGEENQGAAEGGENEGSEASGEGDQSEQPKPKKKALTWEMKRIHEETNKRREAERKAEELAAEVERLRNGGSSEAAESAPDIDTLATRRAEQIVDQREFQSKVSAWDTAGAKEFGREEFNESCNLIASLMDDRQQASFMKTIIDPEIVEDGHKVVMALAEDPEEAERILRLPPVKQALALSKLSAKVSKPAAPAPKPISKAPAPVQPIGGKTQAGTRLDDPEVPMDKFADEFLKNIAQRRR